MSGTSVSLRHRLEGCSYWPCSHHSSSMAMDRQHQATAGRKSCWSVHFLQEIHNPILSPVRIFSVRRPVKEPAMASVAGRNHPNLRVALNRRHRKHGVGNEGIILCRNDEGGDGDGIEHPACACSIVIVGSAGVSPVRRRVAVVEFTEDANTVKAGEIPFAWKEHRFPS